MALNKAPLQYVRNTNGGATRAHFLEDHEPIGEMLWQGMVNSGLVRQDENGRIFLTAEGDAQLDG